MEQVHNWGEDRVYLRDEQGVLSCVPSSWTDVAPVDPFVVFAAGRCAFRVVDLLALSHLIDAIGPGGGCRGIDAAGVSVSSPLRSGPVLPAASDGL